ncbi:MAG: ATP-binding protein [Gammaproteobacteria bacterium]|nr:ATP-binding protein [Gammaproteobacteria bacterium]
MRKAGGNWVDGDRFFDREAEVEALVERVHDGRHTLLTAQRRMGKTSLVRETLRRLKEGGEVESLFVDLEDAMGPEDVVAEIAAQTLSAQGRWLPIKRTFANFLVQAGRRIEELGFADLKVKLRSGIDGGNWKQRGEAVFAALADHDKPVVLAIDELPILVNRLLKGQDYRLTPERKRVADEFLGWLRKAAQAHRRLCLIISGSISLEPILRQAGLSTHANVYSPFELKPWTETTAAHCLAALAANYQVDLPEDVRRHMCRMLRCCIPHHIQQFFDYLHEDLRRAGRRTATLEDVHRVYEVDMLGIRGTIDLDHYQSRLAMVLGGGSQRIAIELLTEAAVNGGVLTVESIAEYERYFWVSGEADLVPVQDVLLLLEHDGYLARGQDGYAFVSRLVEDWWRVRFGVTFVPIGRREFSTEG